LPARLLKDESFATLLWLLHAKCGIDVPRRVQHTHNIDTVSKR
jgi:hypothetical protein